MLVARRMGSSQANGPGNRAVVWFQGCDIRCPGCCNPELQPLDSVMAVSSSPTELAVWFHDQLCKYHDLRGITLSGGEPLHPRQRADVSSFLDICRRKAPRPFDVMAFTGYTSLDLINEFGLALDDLPDIDLFIAGPYDETRRNASGIVSSTNQEILRCSPAFDDVDDHTLLLGSRIVEVRMADGIVTVTGLSSIDESLEMLGM